MLPVISVTAQTYDASGAVVLRGLPGSDLLNGARRVTRHSTLDGGVLLNDLGFAHGDRDLVLSGQVTETEETSLWYLFRTYSTVSVATKEGLFSCGMRDFQSKNGDMSLTFLVKEKLA
jgi:hypothetical protein